MNAWSPSERRLWVRWVFANGLAECVGLGGSVALGVVLTPAVERFAGPLGVAALWIVLGAALEGSLVGWLQGGVLRSVLPALPLRDWVMATTVGAGTAWTLGMVPSTLMSLNDAQIGGAPPVEAWSTAVQMGMAALLGIVLGPLLSVPQWHILRRHVARAGWWVPANMAAWAGALPIIFYSASVAPQWTAGYLGRTVGLLVLAGAVAGAVHGVVLVSLLRRPARPN